MTRGRRQGCPLSAHLFHFEAEILAIKIEANKNINVIRLNCYGIRNIHHADNIKITVQDENSLT